MENAYDYLKVLEPAPDWIVGYIETPIAKIPIISTALSSTDKAGTIKIRLGIGRDNYKVPPGIYAVGKPDNTSPILVTANYKLTFDSLRCELTGLNAWIAVVDTKGINVWCAAGKGTFGTTELSGRISALRLGRLVTHNVLILPQLAAPGVAAQVVFRLCGFRVVYGPVRASDIKEFLSNGMKATVEMRKVSFGLKERVILTPIELVHSIKPMLLIFLALLALNLIVGKHPSISTAAYTAFLNFIPYLAAFLIGCVVVPVLLPWIPFRSFALKGLLVGLLPAVYALLYPEVFGYYSASWLIRTAYMLIIPVVASFLSLSFTGSTTYTSLSGVKREMNYALKPYIAAVALGLIFLATDSIIRLLY
ncbi:MAG TPA: mercury methylation corrinoid protein HgcA [Clostridia bacterium]|nr:mercury methylation corrinoid protein HgcA [Clostridia bacterium]